MSRLSSDLEARYKSRLAKAARELTIGEQLPIDIERVCSKLGVEHVRELHEYRTAQLSGKSRVCLPSSLLPVSGYYSAAERYLIAHEIGHFLLASQFSATALGRSEYWRFEDLCNTFARQLLIPESILGSLPETVDSPKEAVDTSSKLAVDAIVPWPTAAWRVTEHYPGFALLYVTIRRDRFGQITMRIAASTLPRKQLQKKVLTTQDGLGLMLAPLTEGRVALSFCENEAERARLTKESPVLGEIGKAYAVRSSRSNIRVALHFRECPKNQPRLRSA